VSIYHSVILLGINEIYPDGTEMVAFTAITQIISAIVIANAFGTIALLIE
jgi:hypothetical protein